MPPGRARAVREVYGLRFDTVEGRGDGEVRVAAGGRGECGRRYVAVHAPRPEREERIFASKRHVHKRKMDAQGVWRVGRGAGVRNVRAEGGKSSCYKRVLPRARAHAPWHRNRGSARARVRARTRNCKLHSARPIHPKYCSDHGGIFRRMVFGLVPGPGLKDSTLFFPSGLVLFQGVPVGGERYAASAGQLQPALGSTSPPCAARKVYTCALHAPGSVGGPCMPRPSPAGVKELRTRKDTVEFAASLRRPVHCQATLRVAYSAYALNIHSTPLVQ